MFAGRLRPMRKRNMKEIITDEVNVGNYEGIEKFAKSTEKSMEN
jgi:hypothetical protein